MEQPPTDRYRPVPFHGESPTAVELAARAQAFAEFMDKRRSLRFFSDRPVPQSVMDDLIRAAATAPSGAHKQPWTFCLVGDPALKHQIRLAAEAEEFESYNGRMTQEWLQDLAPLGTDWEKPFLDIAPWLVVVFKHNYEIRENGRGKNYYVQESVGIATGFFLAAVHHAGLVALTHTPSPMDFLGKLLNRPENERPYMLIPVGYPAEDATVPDLQRKPLDAVRVLYDGEK